MKFAAEDSAKTRESERSAIDWAKGIASYQAALRSEKRSLLAVPAVRENLAGRLLAMHEPSRQRRVNAAEVVGLIARLRSQRFLCPEAVLAALDSFRLNIFWWNGLRETAEKDQSPAGASWRCSHAALAATAEPLLVAGLPIVHRIVSDQRNPEIRDAMRSDGIIGLYRALERFDPMRDSSFPLYAAYWVRNEIAAGALRSRVVSLTAHSQRKARKDEACSADGDTHLPCCELQLLSLDASGPDSDFEGETGTLHEIFPDRKKVPHHSEGRELTREWLEILRDCPAPLRPFLVLRYYYPVWQVEAERAFRGADAFVALAPMAHERLIAATRPDKVPGSRPSQTPRRNGATRR
ncbi:MAG: sigma factor [Methylacidiphilaceae bacterium]|nr:sigma factor [Candidatus Methylacidiphilaceae bacterium]